MLRPKMAVVGNPLLAIGIGRALPKLYPLVTVLQYLHLIFLSPEFEYPSAQTRC